MPLPVWYSPSRHAVQLASEIAASVLWYFPESQREQFVLEGIPLPVEYVPNSQDVHFSDAKAPSIVKYVPAEQREQLTIPLPD
jgi:hypothetical protein